MRESVVLRALAREIESEALLERSRIDASIIHSMKPQAKTDMLTGIIIDHAKGLAFASHASSGTIEQIQQAKHVSKRSVMEMAAAINVLKHTDFVAKMEQILQNTNWDK